MLPKRLHIHSTTTNFSDYRVQYLCLEEKKYKHEKSRKIASSNEKESNTETSDHYLIKEQNQKRPENKKKEDAKRNSPGMGTRRNNPSQTIRNPDAAGEN